MWTLTHHGLGEFRRAGQSPTVLLDWALDHPVTESLIFLTALFVLFGPPINTFLNGSAASLTGIRISTTAVLAIYVADIGWRLRLPGTQKI